MIVLSGLADNGESDPRALGDVLLQKPFSADSLIPAVRRVAIPADARTA